MNNIDTRDIIINTLIKLRKDKQYKINLIVVDSKRSSKTHKFEKLYPDSFFDLGVMEQNAVNVAAGLASCGETVVFLGIATFITMRCFEQIRTVVAYNNFNVKIIGLWCGLYYSNQGHTHIPSEDIAIMRPLSNVTIYSPSDNIDVKYVTEESIKNSGFVYIHVENPLVPYSYRRSDDCLNPCKTEILQDGHDITLITTGKSICLCIKAARILRNNSIFCRVLNITRLKPIDKEAILASINKTKAIITVEEHKTQGGLGSIVAETLSEISNKIIPFRMIGISDVFYSNLSYEEAKEQYGITVKNIVDQAKKLLVDVK